jgi:DNA repair exonuclease SbcCD nuclease subunit
MRQGLCQYENERVLVSQATLEQMAQTAYGIPLILPDHVEQAELEANLEQYLCGRVADMHYDAETDLWMAHCVVETEEGVDLFNKRWGVSTSYSVEKKGPAGTLNAVTYDAEITEGKYLHLAIVEHPRYEMAVNPVFYNSADLQIENKNLTIEQTAKEGVPMLKFWRVKREEVKENASDMMIDVDGKEVSMNELVEAYKSSKKNAEVEPKKEDEPAVNAEVEIEVEDEDEKLNAEVEALLSSVEAEEKKPEDEEKKNEEPKEEDEEKKNEEDPEEAKKTEERFNAMRLASFQSYDNAAVGDFKTIQERAAIGRAKYGNK